MTEEGLKEMMQRAEAHTKQLKERFPGGMSYLGDGAYVGFTGWDVVLFTSNGLEVDNQVHLGETEIGALVRALKETHWLK